MTSLVSSIKISLVTYPKLVIRTTSCIFSDVLNKKRFVLIILFDMVTMSSHNNGNKKPAAVETTTQSNLFEIRKKYLWKYVHDPLLFWEDGNPVIANTKQKSIHGLIFERK